MVPRLLPSWISVLACAAVLNAAAVVPALAQPAQKPGQGQDGDHFIEAQNASVIYLNGEYGMRVRYPGQLFTPVDPPEAGNGRRFEGQHASFEVFAWENDTDDTAATLAASLIGTDPYRDLDRQEVAGSQLVLAGRRGDRAFLERYVFAGTTIQAFGMEYPVALRASYGPLADTMAASFMHGDEADELCGSDLSCPPPEPGEAQVVGALEQPTSASVGAQPTVASFGTERYFRILDKHSGKGEKAKGKKPGRKKAKGKRRGRKH